MTEQALACRHLRLNTNWGNLEMHWELKKMGGKPLFTASMSAFVVVTVVLAAADDALNFGKVRRLRQKALSGEKLTPDEQTYYERAKAARKKGDAPAKAASPAPAVAADS